MMGHICLQLRLASFRLRSRHLLLGRQLSHLQSSTSRSLVQCASDFRHDTDNLQLSRRPQSGRRSLPAVEAWRPYHSGFTGDLLSETSGAGCSCCGDFLSTRGKRQLFSRPERSRGLVSSAAAVEAEPVRSHEEEAEALQSYIQQRIQLFEQYKKREVEAVSPLQPIYLSIVVLSGRDLLSCKAWCMVVAGDMIHSYDRQY